VVCPVIRCEGGKPSPLSLFGGIGNEKDINRHVCIVDGTHSSIDTPTLSADRAIAGTMCPGSTFTVTLTLDVTGSGVKGLSISEDLSALPSSWTVSPNNGGNYDAATKTIGYIWFDAAGNLGDQTVTYEVSIPRSRFQVLPRSVRATQ